MTRIKFDASLLKTISYFEQITRTKVKDCINEDDNIMFIVEKGYLGKAIGKKASNVKKIGFALKKKIRIVEFSEDMLKFIKNLIYPLKISDIKKEEGLVTITGPDKNTKSLIIGRNAQNLRKTEQITKRYFSLDEIKVI